MVFRQRALSKVYQLIEPGPVVLLTTASRGCPNIMTMSWHMMVEFEPPLIACVVSEANFCFAASPLNRRGHNRNSLTQSC
ncbi:flavin reductase [Bradyrhizobium diazoefficiens]|jgi:flavin reductase (DIM6/NTAB) family NADH-FMN oxidoreductase RutF|uniref:flavin reductase n=1 Tax=Bradyrhizobium diazoefficiens TaxID=1355477 RepID=UPI0034E43C95